jgi:hypothetical protein
VKCEFGDSLLGCFSSFVRSLRGFFRGLGGFTSGLRGFFSYLFSGLGFSYLFSGLGSFLGCLSSGLDGFLSCLTGCFRCLCSLVRRAIRSFGGLTGRIVGLLAAHHGANDRED